MQMNGRSAAAINTDNDDDDDGDGARRYSDDSL